MIERRFHAQPLYPGSFFPEEGASVRIDNPGTETATAPFKESDTWFAVEVTESWWRRWKSDEEVEWRVCKDTPATPIRRHRIYRGEVLTAADVEALDDGQDYSILLSNMRGNGWERIVRTNRGNFQPVEAHDVVIAP